LLFAERLKNKISQNIFQAIAISDQQGLIMCKILMEYALKMFY